MLRNQFGRLASGIALATLISVGSGTTQTTCRGYKTRSPFGEVCSWGCGGSILCNCVVGACADGTVVVI
jgi:hypothetical protein